MFLLEGCKGTCQMLYYRMCQGSCYIPGGYVSVRRVTQPLLVVALEALLADLQPETTHLTRNLV